MWIYETSGNRSEECAESLKIPQEDIEEEQHLSAPESTVQIHPQPLQRPEKAPRHTAVTRDCWFLAAAFLLGSLAAGALQAVCDSQQTEILGYYLDAWRTLFATGDLKNVVHLFGAEYLALGMVVSLFLFLGFSALGPLLIFGSMMLYGLGSGLLLVQLSDAGGWRMILQVLLWTGIPSALAGGCLCMFGATALQVSSNIRAYSFRNRPAGQAGPGIRALVGQYFLMMVLLLPLCGVSAGLSCLGSRF